MVYNRTSFGEFQDAFLPPGRFQLSNCDDVCRVQKGDFIVVPILALNRHKAYWGEDAMEFK